MTPADALFRRAAAVKQTLRAAVLQMQQAGTGIGRMASRVAAYFDPAYAAKRDPAGRLVQADAPTNPIGVASAGARAIMLHETSKAHGEATKAHAKRHGHRVQWLLAPGHAEADECDGNASEDVGYGPGVYPPDDVPDYPTHLRCLCVIVDVGSGEVESD